MTRSAIRNFVVLAVTQFCLLTSQICVVHAQSIDSREPSMMVTNDLRGEDEARGQSYYYAFVGGPGDVVVSIDGSTDYYSSSMHVLLSDSSARQLADVTANATTGGASKSAKVHLSTREPIVLRVMFDSNVGVHVKWEVHLAGAISFNADTVDVGDGAKAKRPTAIHKAASSENSLSNIQTANTTESGSDSLANAEAQGAAAAAVSKAAAVVSKSESDDGDASDNAPNSDTPIEDKWAFIVGISKFQKPEINLRYSSKDAKDLYDYLIKEAHFAPDHVQLLLNEQATKERVMAELGDKWLPRVAHPNDLVLIFISSHGSPSQMDLEGLNYLVMYDTDPDSLYATGLPLQELASAVKQRVHSNRVVVIIDACHSGAANPAKGMHFVGNVDSTALLQGTGQLIICSSKPNQVSWESKRYENGVFTRQLIEALRSQSGKATLGQVFDRLRESVQSEVLEDRRELQTAVLKSKWQGEGLILTTPPTKPRAVPSDLKIPR